MHSYGFFQEIPDPPDDPIWHEIRPDEHGVYGWQALCGAPRLLITIRHMLTPSDHICPKCWEKRLEQIKQYFGEGEANADYERGL